MRRRGAGRRLRPGGGLSAWRAARRPALALDLVEPLRPLIADAAALALLNTGEFSPGDLRRDGGTVLLADSGRHIALSALERRLADAAPMAGEGSREDYRAAIWRHARRLAATLRAGKTDAPPIERR
jgi:CRISPR-associated protein Cas1